MVGTVLGFALLVVVFIAAMHGTMWAIDAVANRVVGAEVQARKPANTGRVYIGRAADGRLIAESRDYRTVCRAIWAECGKPGASIVSYYTFDGRRHYKGEYCIG